MSVSRSWTAKGRRAGSGLALVLLALLQITSQPSPLGAEPPRSGSAGDPQWVREAIRSPKEDAVYRTGLLRLVARLPDHPEVLYPLARAEARLGHRPAALALLGRLAAMGLTLDAAADPDLRELARDAAFAATARRFAGNARPVDHGTFVAALPDPHLLAEDIAFDPRSQTFYVSSVHRGKILALSRAGAWSDFVPAPPDTGWGVLALAVDAKRRALWATTAAMPQAAGYRAADAGRSALLRFDLATGRLAKRYDVGPDARHPQGHSLGDLALGPKGEVFVSDGIGGDLYELPPDGAAMRPIVAPGTLLSPQTPTTLADGRLLVADYMKGIALVTPATGRTTWLPHPADLTLVGIDGLYRIGDRLLVVQNGTEPPRLLRLALASNPLRVVRWEVMESGPALGDPTHGVVVGRDFYFLADSGWERWSDDGAERGGATAIPPMIWRTPVRPETARGLSPRAAKAAPTPP